MPDRIERIARFKQLTEHILPAKAREGGWPLRLDHCFKRVCLDHAFQDVWYNHVARPAELHIEGEALERAIACAETIDREGKPVLAERNRQSLIYRGKSR